jgi:intron-binding protein aquarius
MEEAAQILEVETLIPMLLQDTDPVDGCRLKRAVLIGDHHQLPPVVKHMAFQKFSKLDQSLFTRFIRLGVPAVQLDRQGRARAEIAALYSWRYQHANCQLGNLDGVLQQPQFLVANPGFLHTFQFIDVPAFKGQGELCPTPHFYQNLGEAEYVVAVYQYMRLLGYPAEKISIITTYNGQMNLIQDIVSQRCKNAIFGAPASISTVDKFQGQQNDYILLSMVRTESVGHVRDIRRLVVALSRARLGLYVFGRQKLFENCYELTNAFSLLLRHPSKLQLVVNEAYPHTSRLVGAYDGAAAAASPSASASKSKKQATEAAESVVYPVDDVTAMGVLVYQMVQQAQSLQLQQQQQQLQQPMIE